MSTKAILLAVRDQLEAAIQDVQNMTPSHTIHAASYESADEFWRDVFEQSKGWNIRYKLKAGVQEFVWDKPKFDVIEYAYFWPSVRPLHSLVDRVKTYIDAV
jgi:hypothetical protein